MLTHYVFNLPLGSPRGNKLTPPDNVFGPSQQVNGSSSMVSKGVEEETDYYIKCQTNLKMWFWGLKRDVVHLPRGSFSKLMLTVPAMAYATTRGGEAR